MSNDIVSYQEQLDAVYKERNRLVALLARLYPSGIRKTTIEGWNEVWHNCVYIDTPMGQMSWHYHDFDEYLFAGLPPYTADWDGHTTEEKYARMDTLIERLDKGDVEEKPDVPNDLFIGSRLVSLMSKAGIMLLRFSIANGVLSPVSLASYEHWAKSIVGPNLDLIRLGAAADHIGIFLTRLFEERNTTAPHTVLVDRVEQTVTLYFANQASPVQFALNGTV